ncbi:MAG: Methenyltetrahydrofolate cyclohydrolase [Candidatus Heimdallarchaeota archaeon LC_3]|nr:MAG: Methenyltetrahydrofolate cyclohydrolase [Candidatus Heimdallarchaeota archaeon LC_3]
MLIDKSVIEFLNETASDSPAPGGGSVAALAGSLAASLGVMVCNLTLGKEKYSDVEDEIKEISSKLQVNMKRLNELIDEDANAFNDVMEAFKMPKDSEEQKTIRSDAIQKGYKKAISVPIETARYSLECLGFINTLVKKGNQNAITDAGTGALMALSGVRGAIYNIKINLTSIKDQDYVKNIKNEVNNIDNSALEFYRKINSEVEEVFE